MNCKNCKQSIAKNSKFCSFCGAAQPRKSSKLGITMLVIATAFLFFYLGKNFTDQKQVPVVKEIHTEIESDAPETIAENLPDKLDEEKRVHLIERAQQTVYTVFTSRSQGSAFLYDESGHVITNAHVVEGSLEVTVKTKNDEEHVGTVIGYSNETDVAVVHVPALEGEQPFPIEKQHASKVGQEVIALGTPLGYENTATMGYITGTERDLIIPLSSFQYENVYQVSAQIEPGNSGGPLVSVHDEKIIGINSAKSTEAANIGFSIPIYQVRELIDAWVLHPMSEDEITTLFYHEDGDYYFDYLWSILEEFYFDGGHYTEDELYYYFWEYEDGDWNEYYYDDWYDDNWDSEYDNWQEDEDDYWDEFDEEDEYYDWEEYKYYEEEYYDDWEAYEDYDWDAYEYDYDEEYYDYDDVDAYDWEEFDWKLYEYEE